MKHFYHRFISLLFNVYTDEVMTNMIHQASAKGIIQYQLGLNIKREKVNIAITVSDNGFIIGANPR